ncbi:uncharacterized protein I303_100258 [Kwoniella dejecticola CBS 10117]|uniref:P-type ATPase A domain-containing protein n=1 Tax=Kwoniella dejecticola CBS 10117 TaxID=1296121 RepID=A0A1A6AEJ0_9TREE|nr:uncharacterized protein I303_00260 [Kwoniella dejecticola CBS 10117]OBR88443.1 hypothetical protein I303_00260 [Kwoniella dejecticola CBS 10117]
MDCPDCLNKVKRAFKVLDGANIIAMDYMRGIVEADCDMNISEPDIIARFVARATGFGTRLAEDTLENADTTIILPVQFGKLPPHNVLDRYDISGVPTNLKRDKGETHGGQVDFIFKVDRRASLRPRDLVDQLKTYGPELKLVSTNRHQARINRDLNLVSLRTLASAVLTVPILVLVWSISLPDHGSTVYRAVELGLSTCVMVIAEPIYTGSFRSAWYMHEADLGLLTAVSTLITYFFSLIAFVFQAAGSPFSDPLFETLGLLITLVYVGRTVQAFTRKMAYMATESVGRLQPTTARLVGENGVDCDKQDIIDTRLIHYDDILRVSAGEIMPTDGLIVSGTADLDESTITGESIPVTKQPGASVLAGTKVVQGSIDILVTRLIANNSLSSVVQALNKAQNSGSTYQDFADKMAAILLPVAGSVSVISFLVWTLVTRYVRHETWSDSVVNGIKYAIAVMAVACPCALTLAVSLVCCLGVAVGLREGVVFRTAESLLSANQAKAIAFDKTGTLSQGNLAVIHEEVVGDLSKRLICDLTGSNAHPVSTAIRKHLEAQGMTTNDHLLGDIEIVPGGGMKCNFMDIPILAGNPTFTNTADHPSVSSVISQGGWSLFTVTFGENLIALYGLSDQPRNGSSQLIDTLTKQGKHIVILSGDNQQAVNHFSRSIHFDSQYAFGGLLPADKADHVGILEREVGKTIFVGDGINDTLALNQASISIAVGSGTGKDIAMAASSIVLLSSDMVRCFKATMDISRLARIHALVSIAWCGIYFFFAILLASGAAVNFSIPPQYAGLGEVVSVLPVILVAAHLWVRRRWIKAN